LHQHGQRADGNPDLGPAVPQAVLENQREPYRRHERAEYQQHGIEDAFAEQRQRRLSFQHPEVHLDAEMLLQSCFACGNPSGKRCRRIDIIDRLQHARGRWTAIRKDAVLPRPSPCLLQQKPVGHVVTGAEVDKQPATMEIRHQQAKQVRNSAESCCAIPMPHGLGENVNFSSNRAAKSGSLMAATKNDWSCVRPDEGDLLVP
jgi:hypothetical protein